MTDVNLLKKELQSLTESIQKYTTDNRDNLSAKTRIIHDIRDIGFVKISANKWAFDIRDHGVSYVSFILVFRGKAVDITEDHIVISEGGESPLSSFEKPFTLMSVRYSKVSEELLKRAQELSKFFRGELNEI